MRHRGIRCALVLAGLLAGLQAGSRHDVGLCPNLAPRIGSRSRSDRERPFGSAPSPLDPVFSVPESGSSLDDDGFPSIIHGPFLRSPDLPRCTPATVADPSEAIGQWQITPEGWTLPDPLSDPIPPDADPGAAGDEHPFAPAPSVPHTSPTPEPALPGLPPPPPDPRSRLA